MSYLIVLFKNKSKKKIIKKFVSLDRAKNFYNKKIDESEKIIFEKKIERKKQIKFELGLIQENAISTEPVYLKDELGRNIRVKVDENFNMIHIKPFKIEEQIFDVLKKEKILCSVFLRRYLFGDGLKIMSMINNKIVLQKDDSFFLFSLKSESECIRFIECFRNYYLKNSYKDCIFVIDNSISYKKELYKKLEEKGFDKGFLYRKFTTF